MSHEPNRADICSAIKRVRSLQKANAARHKETLAADRELSQSTQDLIVMIQAGGSTGNHVLDLMLHSRLGVDVGLLAYLRRLEKCLKGKRGEPLLLSYSAKVEPLIMRTDRMENLRHAAVYRVGMLQSEVLMLHKHPSSAFGIDLGHMLTVDVPSYIWGEVDSGLRGPSEVVGENIFHLRREAGPPPLPAFAKEKHFQVVVGVRGVKAWFKARYKEDDFAKIMARFGASSLAGTSEIPELASSG